MKKWIPCLILTLFSQASLFAEEGPPPPDGGIWQTLIMLGIFLTFFYFILFRPEQKRRQAAEAQRALIKKGDKVVVMGIIGIVSRVLDTTLIVKMHDGSKIEVLKAAVTDVSPNGGGSDKKEDETETPSKKIESIDG